MYFIEGAKDQRIETNQNYVSYIQFEENLEKFKNMIIQLENEKKGCTFIHFGDGDYYFLKKNPIGSASPGKRALSIPYDQFNINPFREGWVKNNFYCVEYMEPGMIEKLNELYPNSKTIATEFLYGLTMNKWFFKQFKGKIGLIGASNKMKLIKELMKYKEYQEYLGLEKFNDYIEIPQKFACDNLQNTIQIVKNQLEKSDPSTTIYLFGVGHVKSGLIHHLPSIKNAIYLDIGAGIDGIAGIIDHERPFALDWINYKLKNYNYNELDLLHYYLDKDNKLKYLN